MLAIGLAEVVVNILIELVEVVVDMLLAVTMASILEAIPVASNLQYLQLLENQNPYQEQVEVYFMVALHLQYYSTQPSFNPTHPLIHLLLFSLLLLVASSSSPRYSS